MLGPGAAPTRPQGRGLGGPAGVFSQSFLAAGSPYPVAAFAAKGYAVLRANPRGSTGYGKEFRYANHADWGGGDFKDLMAATEVQMLDSSAGRSAGGCGDPPVSRARGHVSPRG